MAKKLTLDINEFLVIHSLRQEAFNKVKLDILVKILSVVDKKDEKVLSKAAYKQVDDAIDELTSLYLTKPDSDD